MFHALLTVITLVSMTPVAFADKSGDGGPQVDNAKSVCMGAACAVENGEQAQ